MNGGDGESRNGVQGKACIRRGLEKEKGSDGPCFTARMPGNFDGRLFPDDFLDFAHSCYSLQWRSRATEGLASESGIPLNRGNIHFGRTSPGSVLAAYLEVFERDFTSFLRSRSQEMIHGGQMVHTMIGSDKNAYSAENHSCSVWELLGITLYDMVQEGLIEEKKLDSFNLPYYAAAPEEVRHVLQTKGSFKIRRFENFKVDWHANMDKGNKSLKSEKHGRGNRVAMSIRVVVQFVLASHFEGEIMDNLFDKYAIKVEECLKVEKGEYTNMVIAMNRK